MTIDLLRRALLEAPDAAFLEHPTVANRRRLLDWLAQTIQQINAALQARSQENPDLHGMGCTLDVVLVRGAGVFTAHVGDSRIYLLRAGSLYQLTEDHSFGQLLLSSGGLSPEEVAKHPQRNVLTRALGPFPTVQIDTAYFELDAGDVFLLCSDGLYNEVPEPTIRECLACEPEAAAQQLIHNALEAGGRDNVTAVVIHVAESQQPQLGIIGAETTRRALARSSMFAACSESELMRVQKIAQGRVVPAGELVLAQNDPVDDLYLVMDGTLELLRDGEKISTLTSGDPFGAMALNHEPAIDVSVRAETSTRLLVFPLAEIQTLLASDTAIAAKLAMAALERVHHRFHRIVEMFSQYRRTHPAT
jgi:serine/threonine protein phosphatase PrpC